MEFIKAVKNGDELKVKSFIKFNKYLVYDFDYVISFLFLYLLLLKLISTIYRLRKQHYTGLLKEHNLIY